jgi:hypothetical protein
VVRYWVILPDETCYWTESERLPDVGDTIQGYRVRLVRKTDGYGSLPQVLMSGPKLVAGGEDQ